MSPLFVNPVVHLELHTGNAAGVCAFFTGLFGWRAERVRVGGQSYLALGWGDPLEVGVIERDLSGPLWLPYVEVTDIYHLAEHAERLGASIVLGPNEGPFGWRCVLSTADAAVFGLWQPKP